MFFKDREISKVSLLTVEQIQEGMHLREADGSIGVVSKWKVVPGAKDMYNLEVAKDHTFTVGQGQYIVHNCKIPHLPENPDDLLKAGWEETSHPSAAAKGHRSFTNPETSQKMRFDKGKPGEPGWEGRDHYHVENPNHTNRHDQCLDKNGNPVGNHSIPSHLEPDRGP